VNLRRAAVLLILAVRTLATRCLHRRTEPRTLHYDCGAYTWMGRWRTLDEERRLIEAEHRQRQWEQ
jgi:hypothetical protein